nr:hypothetical protein [Propionibacterium sp.]
MLGEQGAQASDGGQVGHGSPVWPGALPGPRLNVSVRIVGFIWAIADKWITTGRQRSRADIVEFAGRLFDPAFGHQGQAGASTARADLAFPEAPVRVGRALKADAAPPA